MLKVKKVTMNYLDKPMGITAFPQFGWIIESNKKNVMQKTFRLQISNDSQFKSLLYDSGTVDSEESAHIWIQNLPAKNYEFALESAGKYFVRLKVQDQYGEESPWSFGSYFITGLISGDDIQASFVSAESRDDADNSKGTYIRKDFSLAKKVKEAYAYTTALGVYHFYINGEKVGNDELAPGWTSYDSRLLYQTHDITSYLRDGKNTFGAMIGAGWYKGLMGYHKKRNHYGTQTAFFAQLHVRYEDNSTEVFVTNQECKGHDSPVVFSEIYDGEIYDACLELSDWCSPYYKECNFNQSCLSASAGWRDVEILNKDYKCLFPQEGCTVKIIEMLPAKDIFRTPSGDTIIDFGQNLTGWIRMNIPNVNGGKIELNCFEILDAMGNPYFENLRSAKETLIYICKDHPENVLKKQDVFWYQPFHTFQGFRYAKIADYPGVPKKEDFTACVVHSDMELTGDFYCSNSDLNQLQHNITWGMKGNFLDIPTDCPQRDERLGWTGDAQIFCRTATFLMNTYTFFSKWLKDLSADQIPDGGVPNVIPDILNDKNGDRLDANIHSAAAWADAAVINPWMLYQAFGDKKIIEEQYESMKMWINFMHNHSRDGIWEFNIQHGDWLALDSEEGSYVGATPNELVCAAYFAYSSGLFAKMAKAIGNKKDYDEYQTLHEEVVQAFGRHFFNENGDMTVNTQTAHILALHFNLAPKEYKERTIHTLLSLLEKEQGHLVTGFVGTPYFCHVLSQNGHPKEAYELLLKDDFPSWIYQVKMGATTIWEHWDGLKPDGSMWSPDMNSFNHYSYGAIGEWLYRVVAGIEIDEDNPGYRHAIIQPHIGGNLSFVRGSYRTVYGDLSVEWMRNKQTVTLKVTVPVNTTATIRLVDAAHILEDNEVEFHICKEKNGFSGKVGSGTYTILYEIKGELC